MNQFLILLIDDNAQDRSLTERELTRQFPECTVVGVGTRRELTRALKTGRFHLAITDYRLPWTDGLAVYRQIRKQDPACPVILYTGSGDPETAAQALAEGVDDYVVKSSDYLPQLMMSVRLAMDRRKQHQAAATAEDALRLNERRLELIFDSVSDMLMLLEVESPDSFRVASVNRAVTKVTGRPAETMIGRNIREFLNGPVVPFSEEKMRQALRSGSRLEYVLSTRRPGRPRFNMEVSLIPIADSDGVPRHLLVVARDINLRLQNERRMRSALHDLRESEHRYRTLADAMHDMVFILDRGLRVEYVNSFAARMLRRPLSEIVGRGMKDLFPPDIVLRQAEVVGRMLESGEPVYHENASWIGGRELWVGTWLVPMRDPNGRITTILGVARDISERIAADRAMQESEQQYRSLVQTSPDAIFLHGIDTGFSFVNQRGLELLGYSSPEELRGTFLLDLVHPDERGIGERHIRNLMRTGSLRNVVLTVLRKDGSGLPMEINASSILDSEGRMKAITSFLRDISARRKREQALVEGEARFRAMFEKAAVGMMLIGLDGKLLEGNPAICEILETPHDELLQSSLDRITHADDLRAGRSLFEDLLRNRRDHYRQEVRLLGKDNRPVWCRLTVSAVKTAGGESTFLIGMAEDISKRREAEQASLQSAEALRRYAERLEILHNIDRAILEARTAGEIAHAALERIHQLVPCHRSSLVLFDFPEQTAEILDVETGVSSGLGKGKIIPIREYGPEIPKLRSGALYAVDDLIAMENPSPTDRMLLAEGIRSFLSIPLISAGDLIGALNLGSGAPGGFTREQAEIASEVADLLAVAIRQARLFRQVRKHTFELESMAALNQELRSAAGRGEIPAVVVRHAVRILNCDFAALLTADSAGKHFLVEETTDAGRLAAGNRIPWRECLTGKILAGGKAARWNKAGGDGPGTAEGLSGLQTAACAPMTYQGAAIGALWVGRSTGRDAGEITDEDLQVLESIAEAAGNTLHRAALHEQTERRLRRLSALRAVDMAISASIDLRVTLSVLLDQLTAMLDADAAAIRTLSGRSQSLTFLTGRGLQSSTVPQTTLQLGQGYAGTALLEHRVVSVPLPAAVEDAYTRLLHESDERFAAYIIAPLMAKGRIKGVLEVFHRHSLQPDDEWIEYLETMATQAAIAIDTASLFEDVQKTNTDLIAAYDATIEGWSRALEYRDRESPGHTLRVADITLRLARRMGIREEDLVHVRRGALMHDIGKMAISDTILLKPGSLSPQETEIMRRHPVIAHEMLSSIQYLRPALDIPYCHHERWDGSGYPRGLAKDQIPLAARVFAIVDVWDALRSDRPYRAAWPEEKVRRYLREQSGRYFDPSVVEAFFQILDEDQA